MSSVYRDPPHARGKLAGGRLRLNEYGVRCHGLMRARGYVQRSCARGGRAIDLVQYGCRKGGLGPEGPRRWREKLTGASAHILATRRACHCGHPCRWHRTRTAGTPSRFISSFPQFFSTAPASSSFFYNGAKTCTLYRRPFVFCVSLAAIDYRIGRLSGTPPTLPATTRTQAFWIGLEL